MKTLIQLIESCRDKLEGLEKLISIAEYTNKLAELDEQASRPEFWADAQRAISLSKERQKVYDILTKMNHFKEMVAMYQDYYISFPEDISIETVAQKETEIIDFEFQQIMTEVTDKVPAILTINAGAGGLEAANWVSMLFRMYARYAESYNFTVELLDLKKSEEHSNECIDSVSIQITGNHAYGYFKGESGVHRLIRNSPYDADFARHTSFAAVDVVPDIEDNINIEILDKDVEVTAMRAGGAGGQHQNMTNSAIRLKHIPTGINIAVRAERDQHANRRTAFKMLKAKLYDIEIKKKQGIQDQRADQKTDNSFGHQIRTYTESPQSIVKDHRSNFTTYDYKSILNGDIQELISSYIRYNASKKCLE